MLGVYDFTTKDIALIYPDPASGVRTLLLDALVGATGGNYDFWEILPDDSTVLASPNRYYVGDDGGTPTGVLLKKSFSITFTTDPIELNQTSDITLQLLDSDSNPDFVGGVTVEVLCSSGLLSTGSFVTNASGYNSTPITYKPTKAGGHVDFVVSASGYTQLDALTLHVNYPSSASGQNWEESADLKDAIVTSTKLAEDAVGGSNISNDTINQIKLSLPSRVRQINPPNWWFAELGRVEEYFNLGLAEHLNAIIGDEDRNLYTHGYAVTGHVSPTVVKFDKFDGVTGGTYEYVDDGLFGGGDCLAYDGRYLYVSSLTNLLKVDPRDMSLAATIASGSASVFGMSRWDAQSTVNTYLFGGGDYRMARVYPNNGELEIIATGLPSVAVSRNIEIAFDTQIWAGGGDINFYHLTTGNRVAVNMNTDLGIDAGITGIVVAGDKIFVSLTPNLGETVAVAQISWAWDTEYGTTIISSVDATIDKGQVGDAYAIAYDGVNTWVATTDAAPNSGTTNIFLLRKLRQSVTTPANLDLLQTISLGEDWSVNAMYYDGYRIYVSNFNTVE